MSSDLRARRDDDDVRRARAGFSTAGVPDTRPSRTAAPRTLGGRWRVFVRRWGWRAYAIPLLAILTVAALVRPGGSSQAQNASGAATGGTGSHAGTPPPLAKSNNVLKQDDVGSQGNSAIIEAASLPAGPAFDTTGDNTFRVLPGTSRVAGKHGRLWRYSIDVENGLTGVDLTQYQDLVMSTLADQRSWSGHGIRIQRVDSGPIDFHVTLTTSLTVRKYCGYTIHAESSCYEPAGPLPGGGNLDVNRVMFNDARWVRGAAAYVGDLTQYRLYMINHEDGHALGHIHAHECLPGGLAPAMMQQSFGLRSTATGKFCSANPWPYPTGVSGAPGAEQQDTDANNEYGRGD